MTKPPLGMNSPKGEIHTMREFQVEPYKATKKTKHEKKAVKPPTSGVAAILNEMKNVGAPFNVAPEMNNSKGNTVRNSSPHDPSLRLSNDNRGNTVSKIQDRNNGNIVGKAQAPASEVRNAYTMDKGLGSHDESRMFSIIRGAMYAAST